MFVIDSSSSFDYLTFCRSNLCFWINILVFLLSFFCFIAMDEINVIDIFYLCAVMYVSVVYIDFCQINIFIAKKPFPDVLLWINVNHYFCYHISFSMFLCSCGFSYLSIHHISLSE